MCRGSARSSSRTEFIRQKLGFEIPDAEMRAALESLELTVTREDEPTRRRARAWTVSIPSWRDDLDRPIDLVEEVLRVYGTERIPAAVVMSPGLDRRRRSDRGVQPHA